MTYRTRTKKRLTLESLFDMRSEPESKPMYKYSDGDDQIEVLNDTINLVLSRDIRKNVNIGANIAFNIARENPDLDVWYVNTYAGIAMMKEAFAKALEGSGMPVPEPVIEAEASAPEALEPDEDEDDLEGEDEDDWEDEDEYSWEMEDWSEGEENTGSLPNLYIHDVPIGTWDTNMLGDDICGRGRLENHPVVVLNSFEFAPLGRSQKDKLVIELVKLREKYGLTFIVFSHKLNWDIEAGLPGRGSLGVLASKSGAVIRLKDPFEHMIHSRRGEKQAGKGIVHETQMRSSKVTFKTPSERDGVPRLTVYEDYLVDPWIGSDKKSGDFLMLLAKTRLLRQYYIDHREYLFTRGLEPTEYLLDKGEYVPMEEKMDEELIHYE